jgi:hypothetical protein
VESDISSGDTKIASKHFILQDEKICNAINATLKSFSKFEPGRAIIQTIFIRMTIDKGTVSFRCL